MKTLVTVLPFSVNDATLPVVPSSAVELLYKEEPDAYGYWSFGQNGSLIDVNNSLEITEQTNPTTYNGDYISISNGYNKGLITPKQDTGVYTVCSIMRVDSRPTPTFYFGNFGPTNAANGSGLFSASGAALAINHRNVNNFTQGTTLVIPEDEWVFVAYGVDFSGATYQHKVQLQGNLHQESFMSSTSYVPGGNLGIGNTNYSTGSNDTTTDLFELAIYDHLMSDTELNDVHTRMINRASRVGIAAT